MERMSSRRTSFPRKAPGRACSCGILIIVCGLGITTLLLYGLEYSHIRFLSHMSGVYPQDGASRKAREYQIFNVPELIDAIKQETVRVQPPEFTELDRATWNKEHPCRSRTELEPYYKRRKFVKHVEANRKWAAVLREYSNLHRACLHKIDYNATRYFLARNDSSGCKFAVAGGPGWAGLGNKVIPTLAVLLYAVLTQRVLLVPAPKLLPDIMCEPFEGSSWGVDPEMRFTPSEQHEDMWRPFSEFESMVDTTIARGSSGRNPTNLYAVRAVQWCQPVPRFYCNMEQAFLQSNVPWIYFSSCIHFMPKLFAIPAFRPVLEDLFPDRMATTHMIRSVMHPADSVWTRVKSVDRMYLEHADRRVGIQIRYRDVQPQFRKIHNMVNGKVLECGWSHGLLPLVSNATAPSSGSRATTVFVTSLFPDLRDLLSDLYHRNPPPSGDVVGIYQLSHGEVQRFGLEEDIQALSEVLCLSFSDDLMVTPISTFGEMAQAYGALKPYYLEYRNDSSLPPCERGFSTEPCHQDPATTYLCPHDASVDGKDIADVVSAIRACPVIDTPRGMQLVTRSARLGEANRPSKRRQQGQPSL